MKARILLSAVVLSVVTFWGCKKDATVITFEMPYSNYVSVPKSSTLFIPVTLAGNLATNALEQYAYHRTTTEKSTVV